MVGSSTLVDKGVSICTNSGTCSFQEVCRMARKDVPIFGGPSLWELIVALTDPCPLSEKVCANSGGLREVSFKVGVGRKHEVLLASIFEISDVRHAGSSRNSAPTTLILRGDIRDHDAWDIFDVEAVEEEVEFVAQYNVQTRRGVINIVLEKK